MISSVIYNILLSLHIFLGFILFKFLIFITCITTHLYAASDYIVDQHQTHVLEIAQSLPQMGVLKKKSNGYIYLDITNEYVTKIFPNLILDGYLRPTASFESEEGAHITVMKETENCPGIEKEMGREFFFVVKELRKVPSFKKGGWNGQTSYHTGDRWMLAVEAPELEELRRCYGLSPLVDQHDFHISIGFEVPFSRINNFGERPPT